MIYFSLIILTFITSWVFTGVLRHYALTKNLLDMPNARSSHLTPTPRGGGLAIAVTFLISIIVLTSIKHLEISTIIGFLIGGALVALAGFIDDHWRISVRWRLLVHFVVAGWILYWFDGLPLLSITGITVDMYWLGYLPLTIYLVWLLNLYNFMDGIDGIASIEAITVCIGGMVLYWLLDADSTSLIVLTLLIASVAGFLFWNFPRAKIFMGDAGSGFIGIIMGTFSIHSVLIDPVLFWCWLILLAAFIVDASLTLLRRVSKGARFYEAHRSHAYQHASIKYQSHVRVSIAFGVINLVWLLPISILVAIKWLDAPIGVVIAYVPLILLALKFKAGIPTELLKITD